MRFNSQRKWRNSIVFCCAVVLSSCSKNLDIVVSFVNDTVVLTFKQSKYVFWSKPTEACVLSAGVLDEAANRDVWSIESANDQCVKTARLVVGSTPRGFRLRAASSPLKSGQSYHATVIADIEAGQSPSWVQP